MESYLQTKTVQDLIKKIENIEICMFSTVEADGSIASRPMSTRQIEPDGTLWFYTNEHSLKADEVRQYDHVNLAYADIGNQLYVSVSGTGELVTDRAMVQKLWSPVLQAWFPRGLEDPDLALIRVIPHAAEYWNASSNKMQQIFKIAQAIMKGKQYQGGEHGKIMM
ncbi:pyridoxamine 5'-phosphate oxidase family protein [Cesiribacter sp. SM1]|uniref:pyridoxamine 5'-phosphate oxidase family protein n=1 Tax=Cesiribacter sp. SM1 TaxID=2861196 RepID=UPI001CD74E87|nr:pyridoxamine 5'-phosphate oxidase family protein [Cesiribacter sp. SM1]